MARALRKPIWVFERLSDPVFFPVPFVDHYIRLPLAGQPGNVVDEGDMPILQFLRGVIKDYHEAPNMPELWPSAGMLFCNDSTCNTGFQIHQPQQHIDRCPACCRGLVWPSAQKMCIQCGGIGNIRQFLTRVVCNNCQGISCFNVDMGSTCSLCQGKGRVELTTPGQEMGGLESATPNSQEPTHKRLARSGWWRSVMSQ